jgi:hypothetical protein
MVPKGDATDEVRPARSLPLREKGAGYPKGVQSSGSGASLAARRGADALPYVALFLLLVGAPRPFESPLRLSAVQPLLENSLLPTLFPYIYRSGSSHQ